MRCHCGSTKEYGACCGRYVIGTESAPDAESLMRSRYSAYVTGDGNYLVKTTVPGKRIPQDADLIAAHAQNTTWLNLDVLHVKVTAGEASVEFKAYYKESDGVIRVHHELSTFVRLAGQWYYDSGVLYKASVGRNEPCPCGSGKKFKKCCMGISGI